MCRPTLHILSSQYDDVINDEQYLLYGIVSSAEMNLAKEVCVTVRGTILPFIPFRPSLQSTHPSVQWAKRTPLLENSGRSRNWTAHIHLASRRSILVLYIFPLKTYLLRGQMYSLQPVALLK